MKCQNCGNNNANINYTSIINGNRKEFHLCDECARELNLGVNFNMNTMFSNIFSPFERIKSMVMPDFIGLGSMEDNYDSLMSDDFFAPSLLLDIPFVKQRKNSVAKEDEIDNVLNRIQKKYKKVKENNIKNKEMNIQEKADYINEKNKNEIEQLKSKLQEYIKNEEYEKAAVIRDKIKELNDK